MISGGGALPRAAGLVRATRRRGGIAVETIPELKLPDLPRAPTAAVTALRSAKATWKLRRASADADVVLLNGILGLPCMRFARLATPSAWLVHDVIRTAEGRALLRFCGGAADLAVAVSEAVAKPLRRAGLDTVVIRNGTRWPLARAPLEHPVPPVVGHAALLTPHRVLLEAVATLPRKDVVVELAGGSFPKDGDYVAELDARARRDDLAGRVRFLGQVGDVTERSRTWSVGVVPSVDPEAAPLALLEHMSIGLPVVATDDCGSWTRSVASARAAPNCETATPPTGLSVRS